MSTIHPNRYRDGVSAMIARLDRLSPQHTGRDSAAQSHFLRTETAGMSAAELKQRSSLMSHIEVLIADWQADGSIVIDAADALTEASYLPTGDIIARPPEEVTYVHFGDLAPPLTSDPEATIEGFYIREVVTDGVFAAEITAVCSEPGWHSMGELRYADAVRTGSRVAIGLVPIGEDLSEKDVMSFFHGDADLLLDDVMIETMKLATCALATFLGTAPSLGMQYGGPRWN